MTSGVDDLLKELQSEDEADRRYAAEDLGDLGDKEAIPGLVKALQDPVIAVREAAADALVTIGGKEVAEQVVPLLDSDDAWLRNYAAEILEQIGPDAVEPLRSLCKSDSNDLKKFAVDILGRIGEVNELDVFEEITELLDDENVNVAGAAAEALGRIGDPAVIPLLAEHLNGPPWLQCNIIHALCQIGGDGARAVIESIDPDSLAQEANPYYEMALAMLKGNE